MRYDYDLRKDSIKLFVYIINMPLFNTKHTMASYILEALGF